MKSLRVHIIYEYGADSRPHGCAYIRLMLPLGHPSNAEFMSVTSGERYAGADVVMVDRKWFPGVTPAAAEALVERARRDDACVVYSIDDNLLDLQPDGFNRHPLTTEDLMVVRYFVREADGVIVTTELLKERLSRLNENIFVVPNALDENLWGGEPAASMESAPDGRKVIGYMGTYSHDADFMMVLESLRATMRAHAGRVELQLVGAIGDPAVMEALWGLPVKILDVGGNVEYPAFARWMVKNVRWDLAIAPLEENAFTRCKSDIKFLDYGAVGIPGIFSRGPVYGNTVRHLETGYLADNDTQSWTEAFERMLTDDALRRKIAAGAREYTFSNRTLRQRATEWREAIFSIVARKNAARGGALNVRAADSMRGEDGQVGYGAAN
jgi:processive 1,2-diacylglycerol beta-glucosyltransferase